MPSSIHEDVRPPTTGRASRTLTWNPRRVSSSPQLSPASPAPITTTSAWATRGHTSRRRATCAPARRVTARGGSRLLADDLGEHHRLRRVVLEHDGVAVAIADDLRRDRHLAFALAAVGSEMQL